MSGTKSWIKAPESVVCSECNPAIDLVASDLKIHPCQVIGHVIELLHWAAKVTDDGYLRKLTDDGSLQKFSDRQIARNAKWMDKKGEETRFIDALVTHGFLARTPSGIRVEVWKTTCGGLAEGRLKTKTRVARHRANKDQTSIESEEGVDGNALHNVLRNGPVTLLEKRREEESREEEEKNPPPPASQTPKEPGKTSSSVLKISGGGGGKSPTLEDVENQCYLMNHQVDPEMYHAKRTATGWKTQSGSVIVDWKADLKAWALSEWEHKGKPTKNVSLQGSHPEPKRSWRDGPQDIRILGQRRENGTSSAEENTALWKWEHEQ